MLIVVGDEAITLVNNAEARLLNSWHTCASYETSGNLLVKGYQNISICLPLKTMADVAPITPKKGEYIGLFSAVPDILDLCVLSEKWVAI